MQHNDNSFTNSIAWIFSSLALIAYMVLAFMGVEYIVRGNHLAAIGITVGGSSLLWLCVWGICRCKITRNKRLAIPFGILSFLGIFVVLFVASYPVTLFLFAYDHEDELTKLINNTRDYALKVDSLYQDYAKARVNNYDMKLREKDYCEKGKRKKKIKNYNQEKNKNDELILKVNSLRRRILLPVGDSICIQRRLWLASIPNENMSTNISTAKNLRDVFYAADKWIDEYRIASSMIYENEDAVPFNCEEYTSSAKDEYRNFCELKEPDIRSLIAVFVCIGIILLTYFFLWRPPSRYSNRR